MEDGHRDHDDRKQQGNDDGRQDPLGQAKFRKGMLLRFAAGARPSITGGCRGKCGDGRPTLFFQQQ